MADWRIERLDRSHERGDFFCGKASLDEFIRSLVSQYEKRNLGRTYVAVREGEKRVYGFYTLASSAVPFAHVPAKSARKLPRHPIPVALLARLAVDRTAQGQGLGAELLMDALRRCRELAAALGIFAVEVLAIDDEARRFYEKYGFIPLLDDQRHLYLPMKTLETVLGEEEAEESWRTVPMKRFVLFSHQNCKSDARNAPPQAEPIRRAIFVCGLTSISASKCANSAKKRLDRIAFGIPLATICNGETNPPVL